MEFTVRAAGIDTASLCWYAVEGDRAHRAMTALATVPAARSKLIAAPIAGQRVGWFPDSGLIFSEGHPSPDGLASADALPALRDRVEDGLAAIGVPLDPRRTVRRWNADLPQCSDRRAGFAGVRRLDATCDLAFASPVHGLAALTGVAALTPPRVKMNVWRESGGRRIETVALHGLAGGQLLGRWYDKGVEAGTARRGTLLRPEDQRRYKAHARLPVEAMTGEYVRSNFHGRFVPLWKASKGIIVGTPIQLAGRLAELQDEEALTPGQAKAVAGHLVLEAAGAQRQTVRQRRRDRALARRHGLVLADGEETCEVPIESVLEACLDAEGW
jgi:hypothetical protein